MTWLEIENITQSTLTILRENMGLKAGERLLIVTDTPCPQDWQTMPLAGLQSMLELGVLARLMAEVAEEHFPDCHVAFCPFPATGGHGVELDEATARRMLEADVILAPTTFSLSHTNARLEACRMGGRVASMPQFEARMLAEGGPLAVDPQAMAADVRRFAERLSQARQVIVRTAYGTHLRFSLEGRPGQADDGLFLEAGKWGNLPSGEAYAIPVEGSGQGRLVVPAGWYPRLDQEMALQFEAGLVTSLQGGGQAGQTFREALQLESNEPLYKARRNLAELGIGCNPNARKPDNVLEAEKIKSTIHIGVGDNLHMGGLVEADFHEDFVQPEVDLILDGQVVIESGEWRIS